MELIESLTRQDADLGSTFISEKEVTLKLNGEDLKHLYNIYHHVDLEVIKKLGIWDDEHIETVNELFGHIVEGVSNYDLV
tara:strand:+ start:1041 stop:1280 length:240 start_codon:yes stop_codon:yes gene_type:complete